MFYQYGLEYAGRIRSLLHRKTLRVRRTFTTTFFHETSTERKKQTNKTHGTVIKKRNMKSRSHFNVINSQMILTREVHYDY